MSDTTKPHANHLTQTLHVLHEEELALLHKLRAARRERTTHTPEQPSTGDRIADGVAATMGSWPFIIVQSGLLVLWMTLNITAWMNHWDPYPFILLNLALSFQAAYAAPFIMMSQNRQADIDRLAAKRDYEINIKAELEIELLHSKIDLMRQKEITELLEVIKELKQAPKASELLEAIKQLKQPPKS
jgi:uncharacterized membrane protein